MPTSPATKPTVSVVVIARNEERELPGLLQALGRQTIRRADFEVLVVDDGSTDRTAEIAGASPLTTVVPGPGGLGDAARNLGVLRARADVIAITDADCRPAPDWLECGLEDLERTGADVVWGHIEVPLSTRPSSAEKVDFCRNLDQQRAVAEIQAGATANVILRRAVFDRVGLFNERLAAAGDIEFGMRAVEAGCTAVYSPRAIVTHPACTTARALIRRSYRGGISGAHLIRYGTGPAARRQARVWLHPGAYRPARELYGIGRLRGHGHAPSRGERLRLALAQWAYVQLPIVAGSFVGTIRGSHEPAPREPLEQPAPQHA
jgi:glycosyltransferase involved in cell wall biosynthesis